jgi:hypothetical protein
MAEVEFAKATTEVLVNASLDLVNGLLDGNLKPSAHRSPFTLVPFFRTNFWRGAAVGAALTVTALSAMAWRRGHGRMT